MDQLVQFFFKHERAVFANGQFGFETRPSFVLLILAAIAIAVIAYLVYVRPRTRLSSRSLTGLITLRILFLLLLAFLLLQPVIVVPSIVPRSSYVAVLVDDSRSMQLKDEAGGQSRLEALKSTILAPESPFLRRLDEKFKTNFYGFSDRAVRVADSGALFAEGARTDLSGAIQDAVKNSTGMPLSAIVVMTDGATGSTRDLSEQLQNLRASNLPIYTVGVGNPAGFTDAELVRVNAPRRVLVGSSINAEALVRLSGYGETKVMLAISENGRAVKTQEFTVRGGEAQTVPLELTPATVGLHRFTFSVTPLEGELTVENNSQGALVEVYEGPAKVLYVEGEPRWEHGKMRAALTRNEKNVVLVSMLRSGANKFYRQGVAGEGDLAKGFPVTEEELFAYQGLVLGSVEASFFTPDQLRSIEAFVSRRGGGLLAVGGRNAFGAGKYATTPIADLLPVHISDRAPLTAAVLLPTYKASPGGRAHPVTRLNENGALNQKAWAELPLLTVPETFGGLKPGATVLLEARPMTGERAGAPVTLLAEERYGRGRTLAFAASDTWRWQMKMDSKSNVHETFWRQMLRYLVSTSPEQIQIAAERDSYASGDAVRIVAEVRDKKYEPLKDARAVARVIKPSGASVEVPLRFTTRDDANFFGGEYKADELGMHRIELSASAGGANLKGAESSFLVTELNREFFDAAQKADLLKRVAAETGGKYYALNQADRLIDDLTYRDSDNSERVTKELWDMPINFFLIVGLVAGEWFLRKHEGLA